MHGFCIIPINIEPVAPNVKEKALPRINLSESMLALSVVDLVDESVLYKMAISPM
jgi:hypothetical protein